MTAHTDKNLKETKKHTKANDVLRFPLLGPLRHSDPLRQRKIGSTRSLLSWFSEQLGEKYLGQRGKKETKDYSD